MSGKPNPLTWLRRKVPSKPGGEAMNTNPHDPSPESLMAAIENNLTAWIPVFGRLGQYRQSERTHLKRAITNIPVGLFNSIMDARLEPRQVDPTIQTILADAGKRNIPLLWWTGPSTQPADLGEQLKKHGFKSDEIAAGMAVELDQLNEALPAPTGFSIQLAHDEDSFQQWVRVMFAGFEISAELSDSTRSAWLRLLKLTDPETLLAYTGWLDDQPVASSLLFLGAGVAGLYAIGTIPTARRRGVAAMMTLQPLLQARSMGCRTSILHASEMGIGVYRSVGFKEYCLIHSYRWTPEKL
jgi:ribosomal protein S18 acetylase RimI-like enzyme